MHEILLVRHAKSSWKYKKLEDEERPLNKRGKRDSHDMGKRLAAKKCIPDLILASPTQRTLSTALIIASHLGLSENIIRLDSRIYRGDIADLLALLKETPESAQRIMLVGHHNSIPLLFRTLSTESIERIPTCGIASIEMDITKWSKIKPQKGKLVFYDYPKKRADHQ
ncbi:MAG: histidine phosphatase family protein [Gammaproteobacteria bacterium]